MNAETIAIAFCQAMQRNLSVDEIQEVRLRNEKRRQRAPLKPSACHSFKYCDPIAILDEVFLEHTGTYCDLMDKDGVQMYNDAFTIARDNNYEPATIGRDKEKAA